MSRVNLYAKNHRCQEIGYRVKDSYYYNPMGLLGWDFVGSDSNRPIQIRDRIFHNSVLPTSITFVGQVESRSDLIEQ